MRNGGAPAPRGYQGAPPRGHHHTTGVPVHISVARLEEEYQNAALFADETGGALQPQTGKTYEHLDKGDPRDLDLLEGTQARQAGRRKASRHLLAGPYKGDRAEPWDQLTLPTSGVSEATLWSVSAVNVYGGCMSVG
jgi:hypothetical protein